MQLNLTQARRQFSALLEAVERGEEFVIARNGKPIAKLVAIKKHGKRQLGAFPMHIQSDLLEPTDPEIVVSFYSKI